MQQLQSRKAWGVTRAELERQLQQQRRSAEADKAASLQSLKDLFQRCDSASPAHSTRLGLFPLTCLHEALGILQRALLPVVGGRQLA